jgi:hypothetical protein
VAVRAQDCGNAAADKAACAEEDDVHAELLVVGGGNVQAAFSERVWRGHAMPLCEFLKFEGIVPY